MNPEIQQRLREVMRNSETPIEKVVFFATTRGSKWTLRVEPTSAPGFLAYITTRNGQGSGSGGGDKEMTMLRVAQAIHDSAYCDGRHFVIHHDELGVTAELALHNKAAWFPASKINRLHRIQQAAREGTGVQQLSALLG